MPLIDVPYSIRSVTCKTIPNFFVDANWGRKECMCFPFFQDNSILTFVLRNPSRVKERYYIAGLP